MSHLSFTTADTTERRLALRRDIGRLRRRLDRRANRVLAPTMLVSSCRDYVGRYPGRALLSAAFLGFVMWGRLPHGWNLRGVVARARKFMAGEFWSDLWREVKQAVSVASRRDSNPGS